MRFICPKKIYVNSSNYLLHYYAVGTCFFHLPKTHFMFKIHGIKTVMLIEGLMNSLMLFKNAKIIVPATGPSHYR